MTLLLFGAGKMPGRQADGADDVGLDVPSDAKLLLQASRGTGAVAELDDRQAREVDAEQINV